MAATVSVTINTSTYTALSSTETAASVFVKRGQSVRLAIAASAPAAGTADFIWLEGPGDGSIEKQVDLHDFGIGNGDEAYALLEYGSTGLKVVRGTTSSSNAAGEYETVNAGATDQVLGATGAIGDYLEGLNCVVTTPATSEVQIKDGSGSSIVVLPNNVAGGVGTYPVPLGLTSTASGWKVTTGAGVTAIASGNFT